MVAADLIYMEQIIKYVSWGVLASDLQQRTRLFLEKAAGCAKSVERAPPTAYL